MPLFQLLLHDNFHCRIIASKIQHTTVDIATGMVASKIQHTTVDIATGMVAKARVCV